MIKALMKTKKFYEQPLMVVTQVELESPICSGSADIINQEKQSIAIQDQTVNTSFDYTPSSGAENMGGWDNITTPTTNQ